MRSAAGAWILGLAAAVASAQDVPVFSTGIEVVRVDVSVLRDGKLVEGLQAGDFEVRDNGVPQTVEIVGDPRGDPGGAGKPVDVVLALDVSDSVRGGPLEQLKAAAHALVDMLHPEDSFSLLTFSSRVRLAVSPADSRARAHEVIEGQDHGSWLEPERVLRAAEGSELVVHVVLTRQTGDEQPFLRELATTTGGEAWRADYGELRDVLSKALEEFRSRYTLRYERRGVARAGWHEFEVRVRRPGVRVRARRGYAEDDRGEGRP
jgi:hypothetical protein